MRDAQKAWQWRRGPVIVGRGALGNERGIWLVERYLFVGPFYWSVERENGRWSFYASLRRRSHSPSLRLRL